MKEIDEGRIIENVNNIKKTNSIIMVLKDNAYGIGLFRMIEIAKRCDVKDIAVKSIYEGILVRMLYEKANILILGKMTKKDINNIIKYKLIPTINDYSDYVLYKEYNVASHLEIDIGMNRFGIKNNYLAIINDPLIESIYVHIFDESEMNKIKFISNLAAKYNKNLHIGGSIVYGYTKSKIRIGRLMYENAIKFYGKIINIKKCFSGEFVGYDKKYQVEKDCYIGIVNVGYNNGLNIHYKGNVCINKKIYKIVGKVCMDQCFVLIDESINIGDMVEFFGDNILMERFLNENNMTFYEALLFLS